MDVGHGIFIGAMFGFACGYFWTWRSARKIEALCMGGLRAWDHYDLKDTEAPSPGRIVTTQEATS